MFAALVLFVTLAGVACLTLMKAPTKEQAEGPVKIHDQSREGRILFITIFR